MDVTKLPFDTEAMLAGLKPWVECESPTWDAVRVGAMMDVALVNDGPVTVMLEV